MSSFIKTYPRAKVSRHKTLDGWTIDLIQRAGAKPKRVAATYATIAWADRAARLKLGPKPREEKSRPLPAAAPSSFEVFARPGIAAVDPGKCIPCGRPMRPAGAKAADHPGTTQRQRAGLCQPCNQRIKREGSSL